MLADLLVPSGAALLPRELNIKSNADETKKLSPAALVHFTWRWQHIGIFLQFCVHIRPAQLPRAFASADDKLSQTWADPNCRFRPTILAQSERR